MYLLGIAQLQNVYLSGCVRHIYRHSISKGLRFYVRGCFCLNSCLTLNIDPLLVLYAR